MSSYQFHHIAKAELNNLFQGVWLWIWNVDKAPPHIGIASEGKYYSLKHNGKDEGIPVEKYFRIAQRELIPVLFVGLDLQLWPNDLTNSFLSFDRASSRGVSCLKPISTIVMEKDCRTLFDLLEFLKGERKVQSVCGVNIPSTFQGIPFYTYENVQSRLRELEHAKVEKHIS